jgi:hypothetical protein
MVELTTGKTNVELVDLFGFCGDAMVSYSTIKQQEFHIYYKHFDEVSWIGNR